MVWVRSPVYFYNRNGTYYFSRAGPSDLRHRFPKRKIEVSLRTKLVSKAARSAAALSDRLERYWESLRMEMIYSKELGLAVLPGARTGSAVLGLRCGVSLRRTSPCTILFAVSDASSRSTSRAIQMHMATRDIEAGFRTGLFVNPVSQGHIAYRYDDIAAIKAHLEAKRIPYSDSGERAVNGWHQIFFYDPDGNVIEVNQVDQN